MKSRAPSPRPDRHLELLPWLLIGVLFVSPILYSSVTGRFWVAVPEGWSVTSVHLGDQPVPCSPWRLGAKCRAWGEDVLAVAMVGPSGQEKKVSCSFYGIAFFAIRSSPAEGLVCEPTALGMYFPWP